MQGTANESGPSGILAIATAREVDPENQLHHWPAVALSYLVKSEKVNHYG